MYLSAVHFQLEEHLVTISSAPTFFYQLELYIQPRLNLLASHAARLLLNQRSRNLDLTSSSTSINVIPEAAESTMSIPRAPRSPSRPQDPRWVDMPGLGRIPAAPRAYGRFEGRDRRFVNRWRPGPGRYERLSGFARSEQQEHNWYGERHHSDDAGWRDWRRDTDHTAPDSFLPEHLNPAQFLAEGYARRQRELRHEAERPLGRTEYEFHRHFRNPVWVRPDSNASREITSNIQVSDDRSQIKNEPAEDGKFLEPKIEMSSCQDSQHESSESRLPMEDSKNDSDFTNLSVGKYDDPKDGPGPPPGDSKDPVQVPQGCFCPIGFECEAKGNDLIDCRDLVLEYEWRNWRRHFDENYQPRYTFCPLGNLTHEEDHRVNPFLSLPPNVEPGEESFATFSEVKGIVRLFDDVTQRRRRSMFLKTTYSRMRGWIRRMQNNSVTEEALLRSNVLDPLKAFLSDDNERMRAAKEVPTEIVEDLTILQRKWESGDFSVLPRRGLLPGGPTGWRPDPDWPWRQDSDYFGHGRLVNGQVWSSRAELMRDGAHGPPIAGISGTIKHGARSIVMGFHDEKNKNYYADVDQGDEIWYYGTALARPNGDEEPTNIKDPDHGTYRPERVTKSSQGHGPTPATQALFTSYQTGRPVRVIRSFRLAKIVKMKPATGFRYDGLYQVVESILDKKERQIYKFRMVRLKEGQGPLRHANPPLRLEGSARKRRREERQDDGD